MIARRRLASQSIPRKAKTLMTRTLVAALATLTLVGCGTSEVPVTSSQEMDLGQSTSAITRAQASLRSQTEPGEELVARSVIVDDTGDGARALRQEVPGSPRHWRRHGGAPRRDWHAARDLRHQPRQPPQPGPQAHHRRRGRSTVLAEKAFDGKRAGPASAELVISMRGEKPELAHQVVLEGVKEDGTPSELHVLVNAHTGAVLENWDMVHTAAAVGTGKSLYRGHGVHPHQLRQPAATRCATPRAA